MSPRGGEQQQQQQQRAGAGGRGLVVVLWPGGRGEREGRLAALASPPPRGGPDAPSLPSPPPVTSIPSSFWKLPVFFFLPQVIKSRFFLNPAPDLPSLWTPICEAAARLPRYTITHTERERNALVLVCVCCCLPSFHSPHPELGSSKDRPASCLDSQGPGRCPKKKPQEQGTKAVARAPALATVYCRWTWRLVFSPASIIPVASLPISPVLVSCSNE